MPRRSPLVRIPRRPGSLRGRLPTAVPFNYQPNQSLCKVAIREESGYDRFSAEHAQVIPGHIAAQLVITTNSSEREQAHPDRMAARQRTDLRSGPTVSVDPKQKVRAARSFRSTGWHPQIGKDGATLLRSRSSPTPRRASRMTTHVRRTPSMQWAPAPLGPDWAPSVSFPWQTTFHGRFSVLSHREGCHSKPRISGTNIVGTAPIRYYRIVVALIPHERPSSTAKSLLP